MLLDINPDTELLFLFSSSSFTAEAKQKSEMFGCGQMSQAVDERLSASAHNNNNNVNVVGVLHDDKWVFTPAGAH